jgi:hypothetical protein
VAQVDHGQGNVVATHEVYILAIRSHEQIPESVDPGKGALAGKTMFVDVGIEEALATAFGVPAVASVFGNTGNDTMIEAHFASRSAMKRTIGIEVSALKTEAQALHRLQQSVGGA